MSEPVLHYLYDPFCGWCYGAAPMISAAQNISDLKIKAHGVGMLSGDKAKIMSAEWRDFVRPHEELIHLYSRQEFGDAYVNGVQQREDVVLDSSPPIAAMLLAEQISGRGIDMLKRLQTAYYKDGRAIADKSVIGEIAAELGFDEKSFVVHLDDLVRNQIAGHIADSNELLKTLGARGFPAFAMEIDGALHVLPLGGYLARPSLFKTDIEALLQKSQTARINSRR
ncbi:putative protein-disulfide isomerase [Collimonas sp. OK307]|uniref:DsbA family protein n=1 Tax=Collimonas sp. OK307 TaxID=1801620 RepID=UPI0008E9DDB4|nr:DsbA family protein [Collimonas sp. OK307]SFH61945.1 putative protein-disulfide isomerase [Collimonas sp. OK307]